MTTVTAPTADAASSTRSRVTAVVLGIVAATTVHLIALAAGAEMLVPAFEGDGTQQLATIGVAASAAGAVLIGWLVATAATRWTARPRTSWLVFAILGLVASFVPVVAIEATALTKGVLALQHLLVAGVVVPLFARTLPARRGP